MNLADANSDLQVAGKGSPFHSKNCSVTNEQPFSFPAKIRNLSELFLNSCLKLR